MLSARSARRFDRPRTLSRVLSTDDVREPERFAYWRDMTTSAFVDLRPERTSAAPFFGAIHAGRLGPYPLAHIRSGAHRVHRARREIARSPHALYFVNLQLSGESTLHQGRGDLAMAPGDLALVDVTRPLELGFRGPFRHVTLELPHHVLGPRLAAGARAGGLVVSGARGLGAVASAYLRAAAAMTSHADPLADDALADNLIGLLALAFGAAEPDPDAARLVAARAYVERNLGDPALSPARIAAGLGVSTRYLHQLFARQDETLMRWVLRRRLERCRADLARGASRTITEVAFGWGFADLSHFGRAFKAAFGETPRAYRACATSSASAASAPGDGARRKPWRSPG